MQIEFKSEKCYECPLWIEEAERDGYICDADDCMYDIKNELKYSKTFENLYKEFVEIRKD